MSLGENPPEAHETHRTTNDEHAQSDKTVHELYEEQVMYCDYCGAPHLRKTALSRHEIRCEERSDEVDGT